MTRKDVEIIPPDRRTVAATQPDRSGTPIANVQRTQTGGVVNSTITRWRADAEGRALDSLARRHRSEADAIKAYGELADSFENTARKVARLRELPETLALDKARREDGRAASYSQLADNLEERAHQAQVAKLRRERELREAQTAVTEAERQQFTAEQGFQNQRRLKDLNLKIWEQRKKGVHLNLEAETQQLREEIAGNQPPSSPSDDDIRARAEDALLAAAQTGDAAGVERWQRVLDALDGK